MAKNRSKRRKSNRLQQRRRDKAKVAESPKEPHCIILTRGSVSPDLKKLADDFQKILEPNIPARLQSTKKNVIKDFVAVSAQLSVTHLATFTQTSYGMYVKFCRLPQGPTITFKIENYTRSKDVLSSGKKHYTHESYFKFSPCIMTNIQPRVGELQLQVTARMFLDMFPTITPETATPDKIKRCCLFNYDKKEDSFDLRHYTIRTVPVDVGKGIKKMIGRKIPDLGKFSDVSEYMTKAALLSDSEAEDDPNARVTVPNKKAKGITMRSSIRLNEIGPRMTLKIYKVESGLLGGQVLYHSRVIKTAEEKLMLEELQKHKRKLKLKRKKQQEENVELKKKKKEEHKKRCLEGMGLKRKGSGEQNDSAEGDDYLADDDDDDDDAEYYRKEVGEEPDPDFFSQKRKRPEGKSAPRKKFKNDFRQIKKAQKERENKRKLE